MKCIFLLTALVAIHFALRTATMRFENEAYVGLAPLWLAILMGVWAGATGSSYRQIYGFAFLVALCSALGWVYEKVAGTSAIEFLRDDASYINYGSDLELQLILVAIVLPFYTAIGGTIGAAIRFLRNPPTREPLDRAPSRRD